MLLSRFFSLSEVACKCCGGVPTKALLNKMDQIRKEFGAPINVTSGFRCEKHNTKIGGSKNSNHVKGLAIDVLRTPTLEDFILKHLEHFDIYIEDSSVTPTWIHISIAPPKSGKRIFKP